MSQPTLLPAPASAQAVADFAPFLEHVREGVIMVDDDMTVIFLNAIARRDFMTLGDVNPTGSRLWELLGYREDLPARLAVQQSVRDRIPVYFSSHGQYGEYWVETDVIPIDGGLLLYYRDVTRSSKAAVDRAESAHQLQMTSERLRVLIDNAPLAIYVLDNEGRVQHWNPEAVSMFQWQEREVLGQTLPTVPAEERESYDLLMTRTNAGESVRAHSGRRQRKDGVILEVQISMSPMRTELGAIAGKIVMVTDVTNHRKLETQLRMSQKMEAVGLLAGGVAHDFNNLLTAIKGFSSLLEMTLEPTDHSTEFLGEINKAADRAAALTAQLLAFSRRQILRPEPIDLNARVRELERMLSLLLQNDGVLKLELDPALYRVLGDPGQIEQVVLNLVVNARDAIHEREGGRVTIRTANAELSRQFASWGVEGAPGQYVCLQVRDNGMGMDPATLARIFDPFFTTKETGRGTGLGLATVFGVVKQSGGYVWADSKLGEGSTFTVYLPRARSAERASGPTRLPRLGGHERILLVEDEQAVRRVARRALELQGYTVVEAADGHAALELVGCHDIDLVVTDVMMPGMLGPALARKIHAHWPHIPVLFMSGHSDEIASEGLLDPSTPFLGKPFTPLQLAQKVRELLDQVKVV